VTWDGHALVVAYGVATPILATLDPEDVETWKTIALTDTLSGWVGSSYQVTAFGTGLLVAATQGQQVFDGLPKWLGF
jgi:hypothetical protein